MQAYFLLREVVINEETHQAFLMGIYIYNQALATANGVFFKLNLSAAHQSLAMANSNAVQEIWAQKMLGSYAHLMSVVEHNKPALRAVRCREDPSG